jgi:hypothetical protein
MIRKEVVQIIAKSAGKNPIVSANGFMSRDLFEMNDKESNFYMIGSMGLDGDGNILMNLGSLLTIGSLKPKNLVHIVFDNNSHESTGGQPTNSIKVNLEELAKKTGYKIFKIKSKNSLISILQEIKKYPGPLFLLVKISTSKERSKRVSWDPKTIRDRVMKSL